jgi:predicted RNA-binding Zn ribbon-like protein
VHFNTYGGTAAALAADLVNLGPQPQAVELADALRRRSPSLPSPGPTDRDGLRAWTGRLAEVFGASSPDRAVELVNAMLADSASRPQISTHDGQPPHLHYDGGDRQPLARLRAVTATGLAYVITHDGAHRLGRCARTGCEVVFVDSSKAGRRAFCGVRCANRVNVARHRARQAARTT